MQPNAHFVLNMALTHNLGQTAESGWSVATALTLGRVSNLPTVWTNTLAGVVLAGGTVLNVQTALLVLAMSLAYMGGMFLNDAFDREVDARERPERPIPAGAIAASQVFVAGFLMLGITIILVATIAEGRWAAIFCAATLVASIILYNAWHKGNPLSPLLMGLCRMMVYITTAQTLAIEPPIILYVSAAIVLCYLIGLTYTAKQEQFGAVMNLWPLGLLAVPILYGVWLATDHPLAAPCVGLLACWVVHAVRLVKRRHAGDVPRAVVNLIAGIALVDGLIVASVFSASMTTTLAWIACCWAGFALTLFLQRYIAGT